MNRNKLSNWVRLNLVPHLFAAFFFSALYVFLLVYIDPRIVYTFNGIHRYSYAFELTNAYFAGMLAMPGGPTKLALSIFVWVCNFPWLGALVFTGIAWGLFVSFNRFIWKGCGNGFFIGHYLPVIFLLPIFTRYNFQYFIFILPVLGALAFSIAYQQLKRSTALYRCTAFAGLSLISYYCFGLPGLLFPVFGGIHDGFTRRKLLPPLGVTCAVITLVIFFAEEFFFPFQTVFNYNDLTSLQKPVMYFYLYYPLMAIVFYSRLPVAFLHIVRKIRIPPPSSFFIRRARELAVVAVTAYAATLAIQDPAHANLRALGQVLYCSQQGLWSKILDQRRSRLFDRFPQESSNTLLVISNSLYRALYHTGRLGSDMFSFPQVSDPEPLLFRNSIMAIYFPVWAAGLDLYMDLGAVNMAEKIAGESMENMGPHPSILYRRSLIQIAKGDKELAFVYLNKLRRMPLNANRAKGVLKDMNDNARLANNDEINHLQACMDRDDYTVWRGNMADEEKVLLNLLKANYRNKMAFEYLMAYYLLTRQPAKVVQNMYRLAALGYSEIPVLYEEAIVLNSHIDSFAVAQTKLPIRPQTYARFEQFAKEYDLYSQGVPGTKETLYREFGTSYFFFHIFGFAPQRQP